jgi:hypothetical protein
VPWESAPSIDEEAPEQDSVSVGPWGPSTAGRSGPSPSVGYHNDDISEVDLERDLRRAHVALESAVTIFEHFTAR